MWVRELKGLRLVYSSGNGKQVIRLPCTLEIWQFFWLYLAESNAPNRTTFIWPGILLFAGPMFLQDA